MKINNYTLLKRLGEGATSAVWKVEKDGEEYAMKIYCDKNDHHIFFDEVNILKKVADINGCTKIVDSFISGDNFCVVFNLYEDVDFTKCDDEEKIYYIIKLFEVVDSIHKSGILHLDIKPDNLLISGEDNLILSDFNSAETVIVCAGNSGEQRLRKVGAGEPKKKNNNIYGNTGTCPYKALEQYTNYPLTARTDIIAAIFTAFNIYYGIDFFDCENIFSCNDVLKNIINIPSLENYDKGENLVYKAMMTFEDNAYSVDFIYKYIAAAISGDTIEEIDPEEDEDEVMYLFAELIHDIFALNALCAESIMKKFQTIYG